MQKRMIIMLICVVVLFGGIFAFKAFQGYMIGQYMKNNRPVVTVSTEKVAYHTWQPKLKATGTLNAVLGVDVTAELGGLVRNVLFKPGASVKNNDPLVELNDDTDVAHLESLKAQADLAKTNYNRDKAQHAIEAVSTAVLDADLADLKNKQAQVAEQTALVSKKTIRAPFAGRLGITTVNPGQYIKPGDKIVTLQSLDPIYADFYLPQQVLSRISLDQKVLVTVDAFPNKTFIGKITTIEPIVDIETRNVRVEATVSNPKLQLLPGMFVKVEIDTGEPEQYLTVPQTAISYNPYGDIVYIVREKSKDDKGNPILSVDQTFVTVGETRGDQVAILSGLKEGDQVVTSGQLKLRNGSAIEVDNTVQPSSEPAPIIKDE